MTASGPYRVIAKGIVRLLTLRPCDLCGHRTRCWRWHVEMFTCPTCRTEISEFHPHLGAVVMARHPMLWRMTTGPQTWTADWCLTWAEAQDRRGDAAEVLAGDLRRKAERLHADARAYRAYALLACHHCGKTPDADGDHTCPCPFHDNDCKEHPA